MAIITRKEFLKITGIAATSVTVYRKRGKILFNEDGTIDTEHPTNAEFIAGRLNNQLSTKKPAKTPRRKESVLESKRASIIDTEESNKQGKKVIVHEMVTTVQDIEAKEAERIAIFNEKKRQIELKIKEEDLVKRRLENERKRGEALPTELIVDLVKEVSEGLRNAYQEATENIILLIGHRTKMTSEDSSYVRKQLNSVLNRSVDNGYDQAFKAIKALSNEYGSKRGVGQQ